MKQLYRFLFILLLTLPSLILKGQEEGRYILDYKVEFSLNSSSRRFYNDMWYYTSKEPNKKKVVKDFHMKRERRSHFFVENKIYILSNEGYIIKLEDSNSRQVKFGWWHTDRDRETTISYKTKLNQTEFSLTNLFWGAMDTQYSKTKIHRFKFYPDLAFNSSKQPKYLPLDDDVTLVNNKGFPKSVYKWQYSLDGVMWYNVPQTIINSSEEGTLTLKGLDLMSKDKFLGLSTIQFKIDNPIQPSNIIVLTPTLSAPRFISQNVTLENCHNSGDASVRLFFDRALEDNEVLYLKRVDPITNEEISTGDDEIKLDGNNSFIKKTLTAGKHIFKLSGTINGHSTYTSSDKHQIEVVIPERLPISWNITKRDVHCFGGSDGMINVKAQGGTGSYIVDLYKDGNSNPLQVKTFGAGIPKSETTISLNGLTAGQYTVKLRDSNNCPTTEGVKKTIKVNQPAKAVSLIEGSKTSPLAYNSSDGSLSVLVKGGSPAPNGYQVQFIRQSDKKNFPATRVIPKGSSYLYELSDIPAGDYLAVARDERFALQSPQDQAQPCGCKGELLVKLTAPPEIKVEIKEHKPVNCHGDNNGELVAHAIGGKPSVINQLPYEYHWFKLEKGIKTELKTQLDSTARGLTTGQYLVKVIDANGIAKESTPFFLDEPKLLTLDFEVQQPSCNTGLGKVKAIVKGGTAPYTYQWNREGESKEVLSNLGTGSYFLRVKDSRGCSITATAKVKAPNEIDVKHISKNPTCYSAIDGSIELKLKGGTPPIKVKWKDNNSTSLKREKLKAGTYIATITDKQNCSFDYKVVLEEPKELKVTLSSGFTLCKGQNATLTATANQENVTYEWRRNGQLLGEKSNTLLVDEAGLYEVTAINSNNCPAIAQQKIKMSNIELPLDFTMPSSAEVNTQIHAVNISRVKAERLEWQLPKEAKVISKTNDDLVFTMPKAGFYTLRFVGYKGDCSTIITQSFQIKGDGSIVLPIDGEGTPDIKQFLVSPNPTKGAFKVRVELNQAQDFSLMLYSPSITLMDTKRYKDSKEQTVEYELRGKIEGLFSVKLKTAKEESIIKVKKVR